MFEQPEPDTSATATATDLVRSDVLDAHNLSRSGGRALTPQERLAQLDAGAAPYVRTQRPANTLKAYAQDWKVWEDYAADVGIPLLSGTAGALTGFVVWLEQGRRLRPAAGPSTLVRPPSRVSHAEWKRSGPPAEQRVCLRT